MPTAQKEDVLIAEDEPVVRTMLRVALENAGYHVFEAADGRRAMRILESSPCPMVAILDADLPHLSAEAILESTAKRAALARHAYIYLTAAARTDVPPCIGDFLARQALGMLRTPFDTQLLLDVVGDAARLRSAGGNS